MLNYWDFLWNLVIIAIHMIYFNVFRGVTILNVFLLFPHIFSGYCRSRRKQIIYFPLKVFQISDNCLCVEV